MTRKYLACSAIAAALSIGVAHAKTTPTVTVTTINAGGSSLAFPTYTADFAEYTSTKSTSKASYLFDYAAAGSGAGQNAFLNNNIGYFEPVSSSNSVGYAAGTLTYGTIVGTQVDIGASDAFLTAGQLSNAATGSYAESSVDGPLIQLPTLGVPITIAFNESGVTSGLTLTDSQVCGVLSGKITDWNTLNSSIPAGTTIKVVYRSDGSGTTFLTTQHLNAVCTASNSSFPVLPVPVTKNFVASSGGVFTSSSLPANFIPESGSGGVAKELVATANSIGYLSPDYTSIAPSSPNTTSLQVASLVNGVNGKTYAPTIANTTGCPPFRSPPRAIRSLATPRCLSAAAMPTRQPARRSLRS
jgi:ABC-type phosphate transport system substrate-binding protein